MESLYTHDSMSCNKSLWLRQKIKKAKQRKLWATQWNSRLVKFKCNGKIQSIVLSISKMTLLHIALHCHKIVIKRTFRVSEAPDVGIHKEKQYIELFSFIISSLSQLWSLFLFLKIVFRSNWFRNYRSTAERRTIVFAFPLLTLAWLETSSYGNRWLR